MNALDVWLLSKKLEGAWWGATISAASVGAAQYFYTGNTATLVRARQMASLGIRAHSNAMLGVLRTPLMAGGSTTIGSAAAQGSAAIAAGYMIGAVAGTAISKVAFGDEGAKKALDLYLPGGASFIEEGLLSIPQNAYFIANHYASELKNDLSDAFYV